MLPEVLKQHGRVGLGGEGILRTHGRASEARQVIHEAINQGISYFDSARVYADSEVYYGSVWQEQSETRARVFQTSKSASRDRETALADLERTLANLGTRYLDLWQIHDVRTEEDLEAIGGHKGALEAFVEARSTGKVRFIGVTGHHDPMILTKAVQAWPVDAVMMPVNPVEEVLGGFLTSTLPAAKEKGLAIIGMKILGASYYVHHQWEVTPELLVRFALSYGITVAIVGCSSVGEVRSLAEVGRDGKPISEDEKHRLVQKFKSYARRLAFYRCLL